MRFVKKTFSPENIAAARKLYEETGAPLKEVAALLGITGRTLNSRMEEWGWTKRRQDERKPTGARPVPLRKPRKAVSERAVPLRKRRGPVRAPSRRKPGTGKAARQRLQPPAPTPARASSPTPTPAYAPIPAPQPARASSRARKPAPSSSSGDAAIEPPPTAPETLARRVQLVVERELDAIETVLNAIGPADPTEAERAARTLASLARALKEVMRLTAPEESCDADDEDPIPRDLDEFRRELARRLEALAAGAAAAPAGDGG